jgi:hypothetical protein
VLQDEKIPAGERLHWLEKLNGLTDLNFTVDMLALIDPMSDLEMQIFREAKSLDIKADGLSPTQRTQASFDILTSSQVFSHFVTLNPGMAKAARLYEGRWSDTAPQSAALLDPLPASDASAPQRPASTTKPETDFLMRPRGRHMPTAQTIATPSILSQDDDAMSKWMDRLFLALLALSCAASAWAQVDMRIKQQTIQTGENK